MIYVEFHCLNLVLSALTCPNGLPCQDFLLYLHLKLLFMKSQIFITSCSLIQLSDFHYPATGPCGCLCWWYQRNWRNNTKTIRKTSCSPCLVYCWSLSRSCRETIAECKTFNPDGQYIFIKGDVSLMSGVDRVCEEIMNNESVINLLFLTPTVPDFNRSGMFITVWKLLECMGGDKNSCGYAYEYGPVAGIIPSPGKMCPTVIDKSQPIESMGSRLRDHTRIFDSGVRARSNSRRTLPGEGILKRLSNLLPL